MNDADVQKDRRNTSNKRQKQGQLRNGEYIKYTKEISVRSQNAYRDRHTDKVLLQSAVLYVNNHSLFT